VRHARLVGDREDLANALAHRGRDLELGKVGSCIVDMVASGPDGSLEPHPGCERRQMRS